MSKRAVSRWTRREGTHCHPSFSHLHLFFFVLLALSLSPHLASCCSLACLLHNLPRCCTPPSLCLGGAGEWAGGSSESAKHTNNINNSHLHHTPARSLPPPFLFISVLQLPPPPSKAVLWSTSKAMASQIFRTPPHNTCTQHATSSSSHNPVHTANSAHFRCFCPVILPFPAPSALHPTFPLGIAKTLKPCCHPPFPLFLIIWFNGRQQCRPAAPPTHMV